MQPDLAYIGKDGKLHDDGLHDEMLESEAGNEASRKAAYDAAIQAGMDKATADRLYGKGRRVSHETATCELCGQTFTRSAPIPVIAQTLADRKPTDAEEAGCFVAGEVLGFRSDDARGAKSSGRSGALRLPVRAEVRSERRASSYAGGGVRDALSPHGVGQAGRTATRAASGDIDRG